MKSVTTFSKFLIGIFGIFIVMYKTDFNHMDSFIFYWNSIEKYIFWIYIDQCTDIIKIIDNFILSILLESVMLFSDIQLP